MSHLKYETLLNYLEDQLPAGQRSEAEAHLAGSCEECGHRLDLLRKVLHSAVEDRTTPPPAAVLKQAVDIPLTHAKLSRPTAWKTLIAALTFDSHLQLSSALTRGAVRERQLLFNIEQVDIDLKIKSDGGDHHLLGQVLTEQLSEEVVSAFVSLQSSNGQFLQATETDSFGQFAFRGISSGVYDLLFDLDTQEIAVMGVEVRND